MRKSEKKSSGSQGSESLIVPNDPASISYVVKMSRGAKRRKQTRTANCRSAKPTKSSAKRRMDYLF